MFAVDRLLLTAAVLLLVGIASSKFSARIGLPVLVLFVAIGMLAGSEGLGGIEFSNYTLAHGAGTVALAIILFDGGLQTDPATIRSVLAPSVVLATAGVVLTAAITGLAAYWILGLTPLEGMLLGSIVGSTDAAAVFSVLRWSGLKVKPRLSATLELESGSNDPMAVFLTVAVLQVMVTPGQHVGPELVTLFIRQLVLGVVVGVGVGRGAAHMINRIELNAAGLYPVLTAAAGLLAYGLAATLGGSGFLSVYLAGIMLGGRRLVFRRGILLFHDGAAWLAQIAMFVMLGVLSFPSRLLHVAWPAVGIAAVLMLVARPLVVTVLAAPFRYTPREIAFVSWAGLKGAVPIVLATFPLLFGVPNGELIFDVVFFVVLLSAILQGWSLPAVARVLGLQETPPPPPPLTLDITSLKDVDADIVRYDVTARSVATGREVRALALPAGAVIALITRGERVVPPRGSTMIEPGDHVFFVLTSEARPLVDRLFAEGDAAQRALPDRTEFPLRGSTTVAELEEFYDIRLDADPARSLDEVLRDRFGDDAPVGAELVLGPVRLRVRERRHQHIEQVGLVIGEEDGAAEGESVAGQSVADRAGPSG